MDSPYYEGENFSRIDMYDKDPALWMDPNSMMSMADTIRQYFVDHYPENKSVFEDNFSELKMYDLALLGMRLIRISRMRTIRFRLS